MTTLKLNLVIAMAIFWMSYAHSQTESTDYLRNGLPHNLELINESQSYQVITDHINGDIFGNVFNRMRIQGTYTRGLEEGKVKWNNVTVAFSMQPEGDFPNGQPIDYMENYTYGPSADMLNPENFQTFTEHSAFSKNLIWDMMGIEGLAWACFDRLELNTPYRAAEFNEKLELAGQGFFENRNMILTWIGISTQNNELCAVIEFRTLNNPLSYAGDGMEMKGLSNYWGTIWVSLKDKQIEHASLYENVTMEILLPGQTAKQLMNTIREVRVTKQIP